MRTLFLMGMLMLLGINSLLSQNLEISLSSSHTQEVNPINYSADNKYIVTGSHDNTIKLWNASTERAIRTFHGHTDRISFVYIHVKNNWIISGSYDGNVIIWDLLTGNIIKKISPPSGSTAKLDRIIEDGGLAPDEKHLAVGYRSGKVIVINLENYETINSIPLQKYNVNFVRFSPDGKSIVVACGGSILANKKGEMNRYDIATGERLAKYRMPSGYSTAFSYDPSMKYLVTSGESAMIHRFKSDGGGSMNINFETNMNASCQKLEFSPDGTELYAYSTAMNRINVFDIKSGKLKRRISYPGQDLENMALSANGKYIAAVTRDHFIHILDAQTGKMVFTPPSKIVTPLSFDFNDTHDLLAISGNDGNVYVWNYRNLQFIRSFKANTKNVLSVAIHPSGKYLAYGDEYNTSGIPDNKEDDGSLFIADLETGKIINQQIGISSVNQITFSKDGKNILYSLYNCYYGDYLSSHDKMKKYKGNAKSSVQLTSTGNKIIGTDGEYAYLWDLSDTDSKWKTDRIYAVSAAISPDNKYIVITTTKSLPGLYNFNGLYYGKKISLELSGYSIANSVTFSPDSKYLIAGIVNGDIRVWETSTGRIASKLIGHKSAINDVKVSSDGKMLFSSSLDGTIRIWDLEKMEEMLAITLFENNQWAMFTPEGYWDGSLGIGELLSVVAGTDIWPIDQFATQMNRPDLLLKKMSSSDVNLKNHYEKLYRKRLVKQNLSDTINIADIHVPINKLIFEKQEGNLLHLKLRFNDDVHELKSYNIYVNDVPIFGAYGKKIKGKLVDTNDDIVLVKGANKIEFSCKNTQGVESYRDILNYYGLEESKADLYFMAFGVSSYQNAELNLQYAHKDALDLEQVAKSLKGKGFENVYTKVLTNEQVSPDAIKAAKDFVKNAKPDDTFILFIAGHGMHDRDAEATYYFLTHNTDLKNLKGTAATFETIEDLLQGIPPRNKLFLMDACESGEIDPEDEVQYLASATQAGVNSRGFKKTGTVNAIRQSAEKQSVQNRTYLLNRNRYIYNDLVRRSGAIVFSSSKGGELSYERSDIENGLFTEYILKALTTKEADENKDGIISTDELRKFVSAKVAEASKGLQHPTVDRDNIYQKFGFKL